jgi:transposase InsO family protein
MDKWLNIKQVASAYNITPRAVNKRINANSDEFIYRKTKSVGCKGFKYEIALESLAPFAQATIKHIQNPAECPLPVPTPHDNFMKLTGKQRRAADLKARIVEDYQLAKENGVSLLDFLDNNNKNNPDCKINRSNLLRWQNQYKNSNRDVAALVDNRGGWNRGDCSIPAAAWNTFYNRFMHQNERSIAHCYRYTQNEHPDLKLPHISTFERRVKLIPKLEKIAGRKGNKALSDNLPSVIRKKPERPNQIWCSDHHILDLFVTDEDNKVFRPWLTVYQDVHSGFIVAYTLHKDDPNAYHVKQTLALGIRAHGKPESLLFDNGKDYKTKEFSADYPLSMLNKLGITVKYAAPYNAKEKPIERFFKTLEGDFCKEFETYAGRDAKSRPEKMRISNEKIAKKAPTINEVQTLLEEWINEFNNRPSRADGLDGQSPQEAYAKLENPVYCDEYLLRMLTGKLKYRTVGKDGISIHGDKYLNNALLEYYGEKVIVVTYPDDLNEIGVLDMSERAICTAQKRIPLPFCGASEKDVKDANKQAKNARKMVRENLETARKTPDQILRENSMEKRQAANSIQHAENPAKIPTDTKNSINQGILKRTSTIARQENYGNNSFSKYLQGFPKIYEPESLKEVV